MTREDFSSSHRTLGRISCWGAIVVGLVYTVFAVLSKVINPPNAQLSYDDPYLPVASLLLVPLAALMIASMVAVHTYAPKDRKGFSLLALVFLSFAMGTTTLFNFSFFIVYTHPAEMANAPWITMFVPVKKPGVVGSLDLVAWSWFFSLSMIAAAPVFREGTLEKTLRVFMVATGVLPIVGWIIMISIPVARMPAWIMQALGWGLLVIVVWFMLARVFDRARPVDKLGA